MDFNERLRYYGNLINDELVGSLPREEGGQAAVVSAMRYSLMSGGKRIRAMLALDFCRQCGCDERLALPFASAIEMIHAYSLIHDDLPCMDDDDMRRGRPSCHIQYGEAIALLAGDGLLTLAFETLLGACEKGIISQNVIKAGRILAEAAGTCGMVGGQTIDLLSEDKTIDAKELENMHSLKTGAMIRAAAMLGCVAAGADDRRIGLAKAYARSIGLMFQMTDDILDVVGDPKSLGKPVGSDAKKHKSTYVTLFGIDKTRAMAAQQCEEAISAIRDFGTVDDFPVELANMLSVRKH